MNNSSTVKRTSQSSNEPAPAMSQSEESIVPPVPPAPAAVQNPAAAQGFSCKTMCVTLNVALILWFAVTATNYLGCLDAVPYHNELYPGCLALTTAFLTSLYFWNKSFQSTINDGVQKISMINVCRIFGALLLLYYGKTGLLPVKCVAVAASLDLFTAMYTIFVARKPPVDVNRTSYVSLHAVGLVAQVAVVTLGVWALYQPNKATVSTAFPILAMAPLLCAAHVWSLVALKQKERVE
jgi:hypothetical protein